MKQSLIKALKSYQVECQHMADTFIEWYYCDDDIIPSNVEYFWVGDHIGGILCINDHFWNMTDLIDIFELQPTPEQLFQWNNEHTDAAMEKREFPNLRNWLKLSPTV